MQISSVSVLAVLLLLLPVAGMPASNPPAQVSRGVPGGNLPLQDAGLSPGCQVINASTFSYCVFVDNSISTNGVPANQSVGPGNDDISNATTFNLLGSPEVVVEWSCSKSIPLYSVVFAMYFFGQNVYSAIANHLTTPSVGCSPGHAIIPNSALSLQSFFISGAYPASIIFYSENGTAVGTPLSFMVKTVSAYQPFTLFFILLSIILIFELAWITQDLRGLRKRLHALKGQGSHASPPPPPYSPQPPPDQFGGR